MTPTEISSHVHTTLRQISYPHRVWLEPVIPITEPYRPRRYEDQTRIGTFHGFAVEGSAGDELVVVCIIETENGSIVTPIATKCKFLTTQNQ
jgi:hypothetical protein